MRINLVLSIAGEGRMLPINYQYELSAWIYRTIHYGNPEFAAWLHDKGYSAGNRTFKMFTFSNLQIERYEVIRDRMRILSDEVSLHVSFRIDEAVQHFITGLFQKQSASIGDSKGRVYFDVRVAETLPVPDIKEKMQFRTLSPVCITRPIDFDGKMSAEYLSPDHPEYEKRFFENLVTRYKAAHPEVNGHFGDTSWYRLTVTGKPKSRLVKIKADTPQETRIRGFLYNLECIAPVELLQFGYDAGFGEKGSLGFGCVGEIY